MISCKGLAPEEMLARALNGSPPTCSVQLDLPSASPRSKRVMHRSFGDPAAASGTEGEQTEAFRMVRDQIEAWIIEIFGS